MLVGVVFSILNINSWIHIYSIMSESIIVSYCLDDHYFQLTRKNYKNWILTVCSNHPPIMLSESWSSRSANGRYVLHIVSSLNLA